MDFAEIITFTQLRRTIVPVKVASEFGAWVWAVLSAWYGWVGGSATAGLFGLGQSLGWWTPNPRAYKWLIGAGFVVSMFQAWVREHRTAKHYTDANTRPLTVILHQFFYAAHGAHDPNGMNTYDLLFQLRLDSWASLKLKECALQYTNASAIQRTLKAIPLNDWCAHDGNSWVPIPDLSQYLEGGKGLSPHIPVEGWLGFRLAGVRAYYPHQLTMEVIITDEKGRPFVTDPIAGNNFNTSATSYIKRWKELGGSS